MKRRNMTRKDSNVFCSKSSLIFQLSVLKLSSFKISSLSSLRAFHFFLVFALMLGLSLSVFLNPLFADETNSNAKQESAQNQETTQPKVSQEANQTIETVKGIKSPQKVMLNGRDVEISAYNINDENYFKLRDIAALVTDTNKSFDVFYNKEKNMIEITKNKKYQKIEGDLAPLTDGKVEGIKSPQTLEIDKKQEDVKAYNIMGNNYYRLRDLGEKLGFEVGYHSITNKVALITEHVAQLPIPEAEVKEEKVVLPNGGGIMYKTIYPPEIAKLPMRTCYPKAPKGQIVYDFLERCYFNDQGVPVNKYGERLDQTYRENMAELFEIGLFDFDLRELYSVDAGGKGGLQGGGQ